VRQRQSRGGGKGTPATGGVRRRGLGGRRGEKYYFLYKVGSDGGRGPRTKSGPTAGTQDGYAPGG
jgi:hypothetical protein